MKNTDQADVSVRPSASVLITDLDDTLWNWFELWYSSFKPLLDALVLKLKIPEAELKAEIKSVHQQHGTSEYSFLLQELPCIRKRYGASFNPYQEFPDVIEAFREGRRQAGKLYPGVLETLKTIQSYGTKIVGFTESQSYYTTQRIRVFDLDGVIEILYTTQDRGLLPPEQIKQLRNKPDSFYELQKTKTICLPTDAKKPDPVLLLKIIDDLHAKPANVIYVGDKLHKDILMARQAAVRSVHAFYGEAHHDNRYNLLRDVTHWIPTDVDLEKSAQEDGIKPDYILKQSFSELLDIFSFSQYKAAL